MSNDLNLLHPKVKEAALKLKDLAAGIGINIIITQTLRSAAEQEALYAQGRNPLYVVNNLRRLANMPYITANENVWRTNAKTIANSFHGYGLAFDIAVVDPTGKKILWNDKSDWNTNSLSDWREVGALAEQIDGLEWGGNWTNSPDMPHYQMRMGLTIAQLAAGASIPA